MSITAIVLTIISAYLIGSFPTAYLVGRLNGINIFEVGSGNMGTANATRALGLKWGAVVWAIDIFKGIAAVMVAQLLLTSHLGMANVLGALFAVIGHNWSIFASLITGQIRGGKGAATWWGTFLMLAPPTAIAAIALIFAGIVLVTRYISLGVLTGVALGAISVVSMIIRHSGLAIAPGEAIEIYLLYAIIAFVIIYFQHKGNIQRLLTGTERRLGENA